MMFTTDGDNDANGFGTNKGKGLSPGRGARGQLRVPGSHHVTVSHTGSRTRWTKS